VPVAAAGAGGWAGVAVGVAVEVGAEAGAAVDAGVVVESSGVPITPVVGSSAFAGVVASVDSAAGV